VSRPEVLLVRTGLANLAAVRTGFERAGFRARASSDPRAIERAARVVLPGVGAFGPAMAELRRTGLDEALRARIAADRPTLAICLGLQLLCASSAESPGVAGLGVVPGRVVRFSGARVPQLGWNRLEAPDAARVLASGSVYYANSFALARAPRGFLVAWSEHGGRFVGALERGQLVACQFHPELSGRAGLALLARAFGPQRRRAC
jgi:imidazole glycerol phosphate synthase glutamine amidotransferase subunit